MVTLPELGNLDDILAQAALQPGLSAVFERICLQGPDGIEFYTEYVPQLAGANGGGSDVRLGGVWGEVGGCALWV